MWQVYTDIELPLVFTLDSMEKCGICVKGEELKAYGERLSVRIRELEKLIYEKAGEEFNINSPKLSLLAQVLLIHTARIRKIPTSVLHHPSLHLRILAKQHRYSYFV